MNAGLPDLRIVPTARLCLHEDVEAARAERIAERIAEDRLLRNPLIVAELDDHGSYVVLDGANRATALRRLGVRDALVQVVDYGDPVVRLETWYHLVADVDAEELLERIAGAVPVRRRAADVPHARAGLAYHRILAYVVESGGGVHEIDGPADVAGRATALNRLAHAYKGLATIYRVQTDQLEELAGAYAGAVAIVIYPRFTPSDILELTRHAAKLPTGITRHVIPGRALRLNLPLEWLIEERPLADKSRALAEWIAGLLRAGRVRHYQEATYLFDE